MLASLDKARAEGKWQLTSELCWVVMSRGVSHALVLRAGLVCSLVCVDPSCGHRTSSTWASISSSLTWRLGYKSKQLWCASHRKLWEKDWRVKVLIPRESECVWRGKHGWSVFVSMAGLDGKGALLKSSVLRMRGQGKRAWGCYWGVFMWEQPGMTGDWQQIAKTPPLTPFPPPIHLSLSLFPFCHLTPWTIFGSLFEFFHHTLFLVKKCS